MEGFEEEKIPDTRVGIVRREAKTWRVIIKKARNLIPPEYSFGFTGISLVLEFS